MDVFNLKFGRIMMVIYNLTQHEPTPKQKEVGVKDTIDRDGLKRLLTVDVKKFITLSESVKMDFLIIRANEIVNGYCRPLIMESAGHILRSGGFEVSNIDAYEMLRPEVSGYNICFMVGGFAPLMEYLIPAIYKAGGTPLYALTDRVVEENEKDGKVIKTVTFEHLGFRRARDIR